MIDLLQASDDLARIGSLVQAIFMAANDINDRKQIDAIQTVCDIADDQIADLMDRLRGTIEGAPDSLQDQWGEA